MAGFSSGPAGDVDLDGRADIMVGAFRYAKPSEMKVDAGKAYLFRMGLLGGAGTYSWATPMPRVGEYEGDEAGYKATSPGDMNGDGLSDIIVSGWQLNMPAEPVRSGSSSILEVEPGPEMRPQTRQNAEQWRDEGGSVHRTVRGRR